MNSENQVPDAYGAVLSDLRAKRAQIDTAIAAIEALRGGVQMTSPAASQEPAPDETGPGMFLGMSIADASKKLLSIRKRASSNGEIAAALQAGGFVMSSNTDPQNIIGATLTRRFQQIGDIVKVGRGVWGLKEWYPNKSFKVYAKANNDLSKSVTIEHE